MVIILAVIIFCILYSIAVIMAFEEAERADPLELAEYIIWYSYTHLKKMVDVNHIMTILYLAQLQFLSRYDRPLFDEDFEAWQTGSVLPSVYLHYRIYCCCYIPVNFENLKEGVALPNWLQGKKLQVINNIIKNVSPLKGFQALDEFTKGYAWSLHHNQLDKTISKKNLLEEIGK